ncbi:MAG: N-acetyltransferase [Firmicutes bacterium]|nr:N-acetyltransferase [Bacillota bacterium]
MEFIHEPERIYGTDENGKVVAEITFPQRKPGVFTIEHTIVDGSLQGQGIAGKLVQAAVDDIRSQGGQVRATCSYAVKWLEKHE